MRLRGFDFHSPSLRFYHAGAAVALVAAGAIVTLYPAFCAQRQTGGMRVAARSALTVPLERAQVLAWDNVIVAEGVMEAWQDMVIGAQTNGLPLSEVTVDLGDTGRHGDLLARFDATLPRAEAAQLEALLIQARATSRHAAGVRDRMTALASFRQPMALAVGGGLLSSTLPSLLVVPAVFVTLDGLRRRGREPAAPFHSDLFPTPEGNS